MKIQLKLLRNMPVDFILFELILRSLAKIVRELHSHTFYIIYRNEDNEIV